MAPQLLLIPGFYPDDDLFELTINTFMKSNEIIPEEILDEYSNTDKSIIDHLTKQGYKLLGQGVDQTAFLEPSGTVLKIFGTQGTTRAPGKDREKPKFSNDHKMFFRWAEYCNKNKNNPFLPKFSGFESFYWKDRVYLQIRQEMLKPIDGRVGSLLSKFTEAIYGDYLETLPELDKWMAKFAPSYVPDLQQLKKQLGPKGLQLLLSTMLKLYRVSESRGYEFDLHAGNFMARADGTPVILDPWVIDTSW
jgi:hypothetical protein